MRMKIPENLTQHAYRLIRDGILQGELNNRQRLTEDYFAQEFHISKSPIREALNRLEAEGLIKIIPRRGAFVRDFSLGDVQEIYEMREILEAAVIRGIKVDEKLADQLRKSREKAQECIKAGDKLGYISADASFHTILARAHSNSRLRTVLEGMHNQLIILRHRTFELSGRTSVVQHGRILTALARGDNEAAADLMIEHIRFVRDKLIASLKQRNGESAVTPDDEVSLETSNHVGKTHGSQRKAAHATTKRWSERQPPLETDSAGDS
jgi:DNA-binding GntR family transcriptional regulator